MQVCSNCSAQNQEGALFCERCGVVLKTVALSTKQLGEDQDNLSAGSPVLSADHVILIHIDGLPDPIVMKVEKPLILGRTSETSDELSAFNLEAYHAVENGVSRRHARLTRADDRIFIRDLGSTNHTYLNGERLHGEEDYALRDGDHIQLGHLGFRIFFK